MRIKLTSADDQKGLNLVAGGMLHQTTDCGRFVGGPEIMQVELISNDKSASRQEIKH